MAFGSAVVAGWSSSILALSLALHRRIESASSAARSTAHILLQIPLGQYLIGDSESERRALVIEEGRQAGGEAGRQIQRKSGGKVREQVMGRQDGVGLEARIGGGVPAGGCGRGVQSQRRRQNPRFQHHHRCGRLVGCWRAAAKLYEVAGATRSGKRFGRWKLSLGCGGL